MSKPSKTLLLIFGIFLALLVLELALRLGGKFISFVHSTHIVRAEADYKILTLGESTTSAAMSTWASQLEDILNEKMEGKSFVVYNEGIPGTNSAYILSKLEDNLQV